MNFCLNPTNQPLNHANKLWWCALIKNSGLSLNLRVLIRYQYSYEVQMRVQDANERVSIRIHGY